MKRPGHSRRATFTARGRRDLLAYAKWVRRDPPKLTKLTLKKLRDLPGIPQAAKRGMAVIESASTDGYVAAHGLLGIDYDDIAESLAYDGTNGP